MRKVLSVFLLAIAAELAIAQAPTPNVNDNHLIGSWVGEWSSVRSGGRFEFEINSFDGQRMSGRVNSEAQACTVGWTALSSTVVGKEMRGTYTIGRPCGRIDIVFPLPTGDVMEGKWTSQYPGYGTFRLVKQTPK